MSNPEENDIGPELPQPVNAMEFSPEAVAEHLNGLHESALLIDALIDAGVKDEQSMDTMTCNVRHIGAMLSMDHIKECGDDLEAVKDAQHRGLAWLAAE
jgi:hypothetical protein